MKHLISRFLTIPAMTALSLAASAADTEVVDLNAVDDTAEEAAKVPQVSRTQEGLVNVTFENATIASVLQQFRRATQMNILSGDSTNLSRRVSASLSNVPWTDALRSILGLADFKIDQRNGIWFVAEKTPEEVHNMTRYFVLKYASAVDLADLFNGHSVRTSYADRNSLRNAAAKATGLLMGSGNADTDTKASSADEKKSALAGRAKATAFPNTNTLVLTGPEASLLECESIINELDRPITQVYIEARFIELSNEAIHNLGIQWDQLQSWSASVKNLKGGVEANSGKPADYGSGMTQNTKNQTDNNNQTWSLQSTGTEGSGESGEGTTSSSELMLSSKNKSDSNTDSQTFAGLFPTTIGEAVGAGASAASMGWRNASTFSGQLSAEDFKLVVSAFEKLNEGKLFSNPRIIVANGKEAKVDMTTKEPNVEVRSSRTGTEGQSLDISTKLETIPGNDRNLFAGEAFFSYGITLSVKPRVSSTGLISVEVVPTISEKKSDKEVKGSGTSDAIYTTYPVIGIKSINTEFTMKDGATAVIGGLTRTEETDVDSGIPYLRKIPWIGPRLFGWQSRQKVQTEILVFVTVGIANPETLPKDAGLPTNAVLGREYVEGRRLEPGQRPNAIKQLTTIDTRSIEEIREDPYFMDDDDEGVDLEAPPSTNGVPTAVTAPKTEADQEAKSAKGYRVRRRRN